MSEVDAGFGSRKQRRRSSTTTQPHMTTKQQHDPIICPRCESTYTKFCYYNNYNKTQPRYFCKACKRHWTNGGILRNVPVGGCRKNKRIRWPPVMTAATAADDHDLNFIKPSFSGGENKEEEAESYTDIEELKGLVSWDFYNGGCTMMPEFVVDNDQEDPADPFSRSLIKVGENGDQDLADISTSMMMSLNDLDTMVLEDLNKLWEDPNFKT